MDRWYGGKCIAFVFCSAHKLDFSDFGSVGSGSRVSLVQI